MEYLNHDLSFAGDVSFNNMGNLIVNSDVSLQADNIFLVDYASFKAYAKLTLKANLSGGRLDVGKYEEATGNVLINGNLNGTDLYYAATQEPGTVQVQGNYINNNADIVLCNGQLIVMGDFRHQLQSDTDSYTSADSPFASIYEGSQIQIGGDFFLQMAAGGNFGLPKECSFMLQGDFIQICDAEKPDFWNHGIGNLILNGATAQSVNAPGFYFTNITLANTSTDGVSFLHPLYGISDVFNAYGRSDGTITPYSFPRAAAPTWKDADNDSIPDCLDPEPLEKGDYTMLPAAIGDGCKSEDEDTVSFIYAPTSEQMPQSSTVLAALYAKDKLVELRTVELIMESGQIQKLEIELPSHDIDCVKIFQLNTAAFEPLWFASCWSNSEQ